MEDVFDNLNKPSWKPKFVSEFSMGTLDFERYNEWLKHCENWSAMINSTDIPTLEMIQNYFASLNVLWKSWRPIVSVATTIKELDDAIKDTRKLKRFWEDNSKQNMPFTKNKIREIVDKLDEIHTKLMEIKQLVGLGIVVKRNLDTKEKIKAGMHRGGYSGLPEP